MRQALVPISAGAALGVAVMAVWAASVPQSWAWPSVAVLGLLAASWAAWSIGSRWAWPKR